MRPCTVPKMEAASGIVKEARTNIAVIMVLKLEYVGLAVSISFLAADHVLRYARTKAPMRTGTKTGTNVCAWVGTRTGRALALRVSCEAERGRNRYRRE